MDGPFPQGAPGEAALTDPLAWNNAFTSSLSAPLWPASCYRSRPTHPSLDLDLFHRERERERGSSEAQVGSPGNWIIRARNSGGETRLTENSRASPVSCFASAPGLLCCAPRLLSAQEIEGKRTGNMVSKLLASVPEKRI